MVVWFPHVSGSGSKNTGSDEGNNDRLGNLSFFSIQTNTIYPPKLEVEWYDTKWNGFFIIR